MIVFISWSGSLSKQVASILRDWLPTVLQSVDVWVSSEDISKGARWSPEVAKALDDSIFGIICVVPGNVAEPWLNFEAGALSKSLENSRVTPFLFALSPTDLSGPLTQFQATGFSRDEILNLIYSMNESCPKSVSKDRLKRIFDLCWPGLKNELDSLMPIAQELIRETKEVSGQNRSAELVDLQSQFIRYQEDTARINTALVERIGHQQEVLNSIDAKLEERLTIMDTLSIKLQKDTVDDEARSLVKESRQLEHKIAKDIEQLKIAWKGKSFSKGDRIRIYKRAGTFKPNETSHKMEVCADKGATGTFLGGKKRDPESDEVQLAVVRWDKQEWKEDKGNSKVALNNFVAIIHVDYLEST